MVNITAMQQITTISKNGQLTLPPMILENLETYSEERITEFNVAQDSIADWVATKL